MKNGFISLTAVAIGVFAVSLVLGGGYAAVKISELEQQNQQLAAKLETVEGEEESTNADEERAASAPIATTSSEAATSSQVAVADEENDPEPQPAEATPSEPEPSAPVVEERVVYVPTEPEVSDADRQAEIDAAVEAALATREEAEDEAATEQSSEKDSGSADDELITSSTNEGDVSASQDGIDVNILYTKQTPFYDDDNDYYHYGYGGYQIVMEVQAIGSDILLPMATTDTSSATIGLEYDVLGLDSGFDLNSEILCPLRRDGMCLFKSDRARELTLTVYVYPEEDGLIAVEFDRINYFQNGELKTFDIGRKTSRIEVNGIVSFGF